MTTTTTPPLAAVITTVKPARRRPRLNAWGKIMVYPPMIAGSLGLTGAIIAGTIQAITAPDPMPTVKIGAPIKIKGCATEDSCTIDYSGDAIWTITATRP